MQSRKSSGNNMLHMIIERQGSGYSDPKSLKDRFVGNSFIKNRIGPKGAPEAKRRAKAFSNFKNMPEFETHSTTLSISNFNLECKYSIVE